MNIKVFFIAGIVVTGALGLLLLRIGERRNARDDLLRTRPGPQAPAPESRSEIAPPVPTSRVASPPSMDAPVSEGSNAEDAAAVERDQRRAIRLAVDATMRSEGIDSAASSTFAATVDQTIALAGAPPEIVIDASCSSSFCRVIFSRGSRDEQLELLSAVQGRPGFREAGIAHLESDGTSYVYLARNVPRFPPHLLSGTQANGAPLSGHAQ